MVAPSESDSMVSMVSVSMASSMVSSQIEESPLFKKLEEHLRFLEVAREHERTAKAKDLAILQAQSKEYAAALSQHAAAEAWQEADKLSHAMQFNYEARLMDAEHQLGWALQLSNNEGTTELAEPERSEPARGG